MKAIRIAGMTYQVKDFDMASVCHKIGQIDYVKQEILIEQSLTDEKKHQVLLHEILHGISEELGISVLQNNEDVIQALSQALSEIVEIKTTSSA